MLNVLFVLYHDFTSNSAVHVFHWANELSKLGVSCTVAVPDNPGSLKVLGKAAFRALSYQGARREQLFDNNRGPDIVHAWTPRERVRRFCGGLRESYSFRQFIHLEDNERHLLAAGMKRTWREIAGMPPEELEAAVPPHLSHPFRAAEFLASSDGVTVLVDRLREFVPAGIPSLEIWPAADGDVFAAAPRNRKVRSRLGIAPDCTVLTYTGNVHPANSHEVRSLYLAVAILNRESHPAVLVRTGRDFDAFLGDNEEWAREYSIELGFVPRADLPGLLSAADILVQPGKPDAFNDYRFPSKIPEFLAVGRPVVLPACNVALKMTHGRDAYILPKADALGIVEAVKEIMGDDDLRDRLSRGGRAFFERHMNWESGARALLEFYGGSVSPLPVTPALPEAMSAASISNPKSNHAFPHREVSRE